MSNDCAVTEMLHRLGRKQTKHLVLCLPLARWGLLWLCSHLLSPSSSPLSPLLLPSISLHHLFYLFLGLLPCDPLIFIRAVMSLYLSFAFSLQTQQRSSKDDPTSCPAPPFHMCRAILLERCSPKYDRDSDHAGEAGHLSWSLVRVRGMLWPFLVLSLWSWWGSSDFGESFSSYKDHPSLQYIYLKDNRAETPLQFWQLSNF